MQDLAADFIINNTSPIEFEAEITPAEHFDCVFEIHAAGTTWGAISGTLSNQTDLYNILAEQSGAIDSNHSEITALSLTIQGYGDIVTYNAADFATYAQGVLADSALQPNDNISELNNNAGYITSSALTPYVLASSLATVATTGNYTDLLNKPTIPTVPTDVSAFNNDAGYITSAALNDYATETWVTNQGYITGITSSDVISALGYTPYNNTNPDGYIKNNATGTKALAVGDTSQSTAEGGVAVGCGARANSTYATAVGEDTRANNTNTTVIGRAAKATQARAIAIGSGAEANAQDAIAIKGINNTENTFQVYTYNMLDMSTGLIPDARISSNIARTADIPSLTNYVTTNTAQTISQTKAFSQPLVIADNNGLSSGTILSNKKILQRSSGDSTLTLNNKDNKLRLVGSETRPQYSADGTNYSELALYSDVTAIDDLIPSAASVSNLLADKNFVNSSIATNTANFIGTFNSVADLEAYSGTLTNNDYAFVIVTDGQGNTAYDRYKYTTATTPPSWVFEYELNNSSFTADQWAAINSLITSDTKVTHTANTAIGNSITPVYVDASGNATALSYTIATSVPVSAVFTDTTYTITTGSANGTIAVSVNGGAASDVSVKGLGSAAYTSSGDYATAAQGTLADSAVQSVATGSANGTISVDGTNISVYGLGTAAYTASSAYATSSQGSKADSAIQSVKVNGTALTPDANKAVDVTVPTNYVTTDTVQNITETKTFVGQKKILFKQSSSSDKLGFTLYNSSNTELGALEYRPNTISSAALLNLNCPYAADYVGFRYWGTAVNIIAPKVSTAGDYYIPTHITDGNTTVTANNTGSVNISSLLSGYIKSDSGNSSQTIRLSSGGGTTPVIFKSNSSSSCYLSYYAGSTWVGSIGVNSSKKPVFYNGSSYTLAYTSDIPTTASDISAADTDLSNLSATGEAHFQTPLGYTAENASNKITSLSSSSTDTQYPSAKCVYDLIGDVETLLSQV